MVLPHATNDWRYQTPEYWDTYLPQQDDFDDAQGYIDALAAGAEDTSAPAGRYWDPIGQVWRGGRRTEREIALSKYDADRYLNPNNSFNKGPYSQMRLQNRIGFNPDEARMVYGAHDEYGNPLLDPAILAFIEQALGIEANERPPDNYGGGDEPRDGGRERLPRDGGRGGDPAVPDSTRWRDWWNSGGDPTGAPIPPPTAGMMGPVAGDPDGEVGSGGAAGRPAAPGLPQEQQPSAVSTIDPRYPDFILRGGLRGGNRFGPMPTDELGVY